MWAELVDITHVCDLSANILQRILHGTSLTVTVWVYPTGKNQTVELSKTFNTLDSVDLGHTWSVSVVSYKPLKGRFNARFRLLAWYISQQCYMTVE